MTRLLRCLALAALAFCLAAPAYAHPHVWVTMKSELVYAPDGSVTGVRHAWTFDDMFSVFATQGLESKEKGKFTREELAPLAQVNVKSLKEYDYFTIAHANGKKAELNPPVDYWLEFTDGLLTLHFTLPFKTPVKAQGLEVEMYDPTWFRGLRLCREGSGAARRRARRVRAFRQTAGRGSDGLEGAAGRGFLQQSRGGE